ncbi:hypothetical protein F5Y12DRAFT_441009 [Xylaria sp. FL1777]|nr:hypothetical protein F5Y12DRAFT_441009 [Xylaria sp. FL1777]
MRSLSPCTRLSGWDPIIKNGAGTVMMCDVGVCRTWRETRWSCVYINTYLRYCQMKGILMMKWPVGRVDRVRLATAPEDLSKSASSRDMQDSDMSASFRANQATHLSIGFPNCGPTMRTLPFLGPVARGRRMNNALRLPALPSGPCAVLRLSTTSLSVWVDLGELAQNMNRPNECNVCHVKLWTATSALGCVYTYCVFTAAQCFYLRLAVIPQLTF